MVTVEEVRAGASGLGLARQPVCVHCSLSSFGWVEGGPATVVNGLLAEGCTVMVPSFSWSFAVPPPPMGGPARNGWDYDAPGGSTTGVGRQYTPDTTEIDENMGAVAATVVAMPDRIRGNHPLCSFAAAGPLAQQLVANQAPLDVYAPLRALAEADGCVVLMGVDLGKMTLLHLAERKAGRNLFRRWANGPDGGPMEVEAGGCSAGFDNFEPFFLSLASEATVGRSRWRAFSAKAALAAATKAIRQNPNVSHCGNAQCERCNDAVRGGPIFFSVPPGPRVPDE